MLCVYLFVKYLIICKIFEDFVNICRKKNLKCKVLSIILLKLLNNSVSKNGGYNSGFFQKIVEQLISGLIQITYLDFDVVIDVLDKQQVLAPLIENWENNLNIVKGMFKNLITVAGVYISISISNE